MLRLSLSGKPKTPGLMGSLLGIEWLKLRHYRTFWIMILLFSVPLALFYISVSPNLMSFGVAGISLLGKAISFRQVWDDLCFFASYFIIALSILMVILVTNEYQFRTNRQHVIDGWNRMQFYHAKWMVVLALSAGTTIFTALLGLVTGLIAGVELSTIAEHASKLGYLFLLSVNYLGFALMLSVLFKRGGLTIGILMLYSLIVEFFLHLILTFRYRMPASSLFMPLQSSDELMPFGASKMLEMALQGSYVPATWTYAVASACWIAVYYLVGRQRLAKSDW